MARQNIEMRQMVRSAVAEVEAAGSPSCDSTPYTSSGHAKAAIASAKLASWVAREFHQKSGHRFVRPVVHYLMDAAGGDGCGIGRILAMRQPAALFTQV